MNLYLLHKGAKGTSHNHAQQQLPMHRHFCSVRIFENEEKVNLVTARKKFGKIRQSSAKNGQSNFFSPANIRTEQKSRYVGGEHVSISSGRIPKLHQGYKAPLQHTIKHIFQVSKTYQNLIITGSNPLTKITRHASKHHTQLTKPACNHFFGSKLEHTRGGI